MTQTKRPPTIPGQFKALEAFKDDSAASSKITAAAIELGLKDE